MPLDLESENRRLRSLDPRQIVGWTVGLGESTIATTSFSPNAAVLLHMLSLEAPGIPVVWIDTGSNTPETLQAAAELQRMLGLNLKRYAALEPSSPSEADVPRIVPRKCSEEEMGLSELAYRVKEEPFRRALAELEPRVWLTGIRAEETEYRSRQSILSFVRGGLLRVAPLFHWSQAQLVEYRLRFGLPSPATYFDPTKAHDRAECGLHLVE